MWLEEQLSAKAGNKVKPIERIQFIETIRTLCWYESMLAQDIRTLLLLSKTTFRSFYYRTDSLFSEEGTLGSCLPLALLQPLQWMQSAHHYHIKLP